MSSSMTEQVAAAPSSAKVIEPATLHAFGSKLLICGRGVGSRKAGDYVLKRQSLLALS